MIESAPGREEEAGFVVRGRVQGVGFRWWTHREAERLGIIGTVRNLDDGKVEVMARGTADALGRLEQALRRGPSMSRVDGIERVPCELPPGLAEFRIGRG
jgi:acylphosphatase